MSICKHIYPQFVCFHGMMQVKDDENGYGNDNNNYADYILYMHRNPHTYMIDSLLCNHNLP